MPTKIPRFLMGCPFGLTDDLSFDANSITCLVYRVSHYHI